MKRAEHPSSKEKVDKILRSARRGEKLVAEQRKALRDYLAGSASSSQHKTRTDARINEIRDVLDLKSAGKREDRYMKGYRDVMYDSQKNYHEKCEANGIEISVGWDIGYDDYTIYFPQINIGEEAYEMGVPDQVIRLTRIPKIAKQVYDYAVEQASQVKDVYELFKKVRKFSQDLPYEEEDLENAA